MYRYMREKRTIHVTEDLEVAVWSIVEFVGILLLSALATGFLLATL